MKILFICKLLPHPKARASGWQDQFHYIESLSRHHDVSLIAFRTAEMTSAIKTMEEICEQVVTIPYEEHAFSSRLWRLAWRILLPKVYGRVFSLRYRSALKQLLKRTPFDVVIVDGMMSQYGLMVTKAKRILDEIDIYSVVAHTYYLQEKRTIPRLYALYDWLRTQVVELGYANKYDGILVRSEKDRVTIGNFLPNKEIAILPPWFEGLDELQSIDVARPSGNVLLFSGAMDILLNSDAAIFFAIQVFPIIKKRIPDAEFYIVGNSPTLEVKGLSHNPGVIVTGEVDSLTPYYKLSAVNVVPLFTGGGIIVKTLNGMASGRPTVVTAVGNSGTGAQAGKDLQVVSDDPQEFADAVCHLLVNQADWQHYAQAGRHFVESNYSWHKIITDLTDFLKLIQNTPG